METVNKTPGQIICDVISPGEWMYQSLESRDIFEAAAKAVILGSRAQPSQLATEHLPSVSGDILPCSLAEFEHRCLHWIGEEQRKLSPDNALIALLCDAVRLGREHLNMARKGGGA